MKKISVKGALKAYYYLLAVDGTIDNQELKCFHDICLETDETSAQYMEELKAQCDIVICNAQGDEYEGMIQEAFDDAVREESSENGVIIPSRLLIWNMFVLAYSNNECLESEKKVISHASRILDIDKSVFMEMDHLIHTASILIKEKDKFEQSERPYRVIRPIVVELEKRIKVLLRAAKCLINDDVETDEPYQEKEKQKVFADAMANAGSALSDTAINAGNKIAGFFKGIKKVKSDNKEEM